MFDMELVSGNVSNIPAEFVIPMMVVPSIRKYVVLGYSGQLMFSAALVQRAVEQALRVTPSTRMAL